MAGNISVPPSALNILSFLIISFLTSSLDLSPTIVCGAVSNAIMPKLSFSFSCLINSIDAFLAKSIFFPNMLPDLSIIKTKESLVFFSFLGGSPPIILTGSISSILVPEYPPSAVMFTPHVITNPPP